MVALATTTLASAASSITFGSIPTSGYRDLRLIYSGTRSAADIAIRVRFNGDTGSNYSLVYMIGTGSTTGSGTSTATYGELGYFGQAGQGNAQMDIMDYSQTDKHKTSLVRSDESASGTLAYANRWASTSAITSVNAFTSSGNFAIGSTFSLYGIVGA